MALSLVFLCSSNLCSSNPCATVRIKFLAYCMKEAENQRLYSRDNVSLTVSLVSELEIKYCKFIAYFSKQGKK